MKDGDGVSNGLSCKCKIRVFYEPIEQDDEFSHNGSERYFGRFPFLNEMLIEGF